MISLSRRKICCTCASTPRARRHAESFNITSRNTDCRRKVNYVELTGYQLSPDSTPLLVNRIDTPYRYEDEDY